MWRVVPRTNSTQHLEPEPQINTSLCTSLSLSFPTCRIGDGGDSHSPSRSRRELMSWYAWHHSETGEGAGEELRQARVTTSPGWCRVPALGLLVLRSPHQHFQPKAPQTSSQQERGAEARRCLPFDLYLKEDLEILQNRTA